MSDNLSNIHLYRKIMEQENINPTVDFNSPDPAERREAAEFYLSAEVDDSAAEKLCALLKDPDKGVRDAASMALTFCENPKVGALVVPLISSEEISLRNLAGDILLRRGDQSVDAMVQYLKGANDDDQKFIIDILGLIGNPFVSASVVEVLNSSQNDNVILACIEAFGNIRSVEAVEALITVYETNELFRPTLVEALGKIGSERTLAFMLEKFETADELTRFSMLESFGDIGDVSTFYMLLSELKNQDPPLTWATIVSLDKLKQKYNLDIPFDETTKNALVSTLSEADELYQRAAASLIMYFNDKDVREAGLRAFGKDPVIDEQVRSNFFRDTKTAVESVVEYLQTQPDNLRSILELAEELFNEDRDLLGSLPDYLRLSFFEALSGYTENHEETVRRSVLDLLFFVKPENAIYLADSYLRDTSVWNRLHLAEILDQYPIEGSEEILLKLAKDSDEMVRERADWVLQQRGSALPGEDR